MQKRVKKLAGDIEAIINQDRILKEVFKTSIDRQKQEDRMKAWKVDSKKEWQVAKIKIGNEEVTQEKVRSWEQVHEEWRYGSSALKIGNFKA